MTTEGRGSAQPSLTPLPNVEELPSLPGGGYDPERVREAFESFRRHATQLQVQLRVLQAAARSGQVEPTGHAVRMDALHLIRAAADMADTIERDAQTASATQLRRTEEEVTRRQRELQEREAEVERYRQESERQRAEMLNNARNEARELQADAQRQSTAEVREAEARANRLLEQARHQATELTNAARAEVEQTLEWARAQAAAVLARAQQGAEQLLAAAGLGDEAISGVVERIVEAAQASTEASRGPAGGQRAADETPVPAAAPSTPAAAAPPLSVPEPVEPPVSPPPEDSPAPPEPQAEGEAADEDSGETER
jgi:F0F1-type ATP synthase membrane subunit b/b'